MIPQAFFEDCAFVSVDFQGDVRLPREDEPIPPGHTEETAAGIIREAGGTAGNRLGMMNNTALIDALIELLQSK